MRDPNRIHEVMWKFEKLWQKYPDWRLTQLICNMQSAMRNDMFYVEDDDFVEVIDHFIKEGF